jgi:drug/metabolite transporter (DMT)-like permease
MIGYAASFTNVISIAVANVFAGKATLLRDWRVTFRFTSSIILIITLGLSLFDNATFSNRDFLFGLAAGISGGLGIPLAYKSFSIGPIAYVSPLISVVQMSAIIIFAVLMGESVGPILFVAFVLGVIGVYLAGKPKVLNVEKLRHVSVIAVGAALFFSGFSILMTRVAQNQSITGLTGARVGVFLIAFTIVRPICVRDRVRSSSTWLIFTICSAIAEFIANYSYVIAITNLDLAKVGIIMSTSSIFATLIAIPVMKQKPRFVNWIGIIIATISLVLVALV